MEAFVKMGKIKSIGVSNYCISCLQCLLPKITIPPVLNQFQYHVGMGPDPGGLVSFCKKNKIIPQAYSALGNGKLISDPLLTSVGAAHNVSSAQVALKWVIAQDAAVAFKADTLEYISEDIALFDWNLTATELSQLNAATTPANNPSWSCSA